tara:strand:+ start:235 stop:687 length:453 start_codon:yes stop_codon:yes gene_type:complete
MAYKTKFYPENVSKYIGDPVKIICRSLWERKVCKWMDSNKNILRWGSEEIAIPYVSPKDNRVHKYYPDFIAEHKNDKGTIETLVIEVKPDKQTKPPKPRKKTRSFLGECLTYEINKSKWEAAKKACKEKNWRFVILTEKQIFPEKNNGNS